MPFGKKKTNKCARERETKRNRTQIDEVQRGLAEAARELRATSDIDDDEEVSEA